MKKILSKEWNWRSARGLVAIAAVSTLAACLGTGEFNFSNDPSANNADLVDDLTGGGNVLPPPPGAPVVSYASTDVCDVDSTAATPCASELPSVSSVDDPNVEFSISSSDQTDGFSIDSSTGVVTAGALARSIMTPVAGRTITVTATNGFGSSTADVLFVIGTDAERTHWNNVKSILSTVFTETPAAATPNTATCITCHKVGGSQAGRPFASSNTGEYTWYCKNIRNKANPAGWMALTGATAAAHYEGGVTTTSNVDHEHANCLTLASAGCSTGGAAWSASGYTGTAGTGTPIDAVRDSRLLEKILGSGHYTGMSGTQMPGTGNATKLTSGNQNNGFTKAMLDNWYDAGAPCLPINE